MKIGVVIPVYNEKNQIGKLPSKFQPGLVDKIVGVDDGSTDGSQEILRHAGWTLIRHERRQGIGSAIRDGLNYLRTDGFEAVVVMAGNGKDDPAEIPRLLAPILSGEADYVQGSRFFEGGSFKNLPVSRHLMIKAYTLLWSALLGKKLTDVTNGFRAYRLDILRDPRIRLDQEWLNRYELEYYLHYKALSLGYRFREVAVSKNYPSRKNYSKIRPFLDWWSIVKPLILLRLGLRS